MGGCELALRTLLQKQVSPVKEIFLGVFLVTSKNIFLGGMFVSTMDIAERGMFVLTKDRFFEEFLEGCWLVLRS